jgi:hypothetical protein
MEVLTVTNARAFHRDMPTDQQMRLSETARYHHHCFDLPGLHDAFDRHNEIIIQASGDHGQPVVRLDQLMPGGEHYFGDATHFSVAGTEFVADLLAQRLAGKLNGAAGSPR